MSMLKMISTKPGQYTRRCKVNFPTIYSYQMHLRFWEKILLK